MGRLFVVVAAVLAAVGTMAGAAAAQPAFSAEDIRVNGFSARSSPATQSDLAFKGGLALAGNYNGLRIFDIGRPKHPTLLKDLWCPGPQNDVSIWGDLIVM